LHKSSFFLLFSRGGLLLLFSGGSFGLGSFFFIGNGGGTILLFRTSGSIIFFLLASLGIVRLSDVVRVSKRFGIFHINWVWADIVMQSGLGISVLRN